MGVSDGSECFDTEGGASSSGVVNNITSRTSETTEVEPDRKGKGVHPNNSPKQGKDDPNHNAQQLIGRHILKEYNGAKVLGTVISYISTVKLFEILYKDNRMEYLKLNEVLSNMAKKEDISGAQQTPPASNNNSKKTSESEKKKAAPTEASTPPTRMRRTSSSKKGEGSYVALALGTTPTRKRRNSSINKAEECGASSSRVVRENIASSNSGQTEVTPPHENKSKEKSKSECKTKKKKEANANDDKSKQGNATPITYRPQQFIGLFLCKEYNGAKCLGTVKSYCPKRKMLEVRYQDNRTEYIEMNEALKNMAKQEDIFQAQQAARAQDKRV